MKPAQLSLMDVGSPPQQSAVRPTPPSTAELRACPIPGYTFSRGDEVACRPCLSREWHVNNGYNPAFRGKGYFIPLFSDAEGRAGRIERPCLFCGVMVAGVKSGHHRMIGGA